MNNNQLRKLSEAKKLIKENKKRFQVRPDRDYIQDLLDLGITEEEAWNQILLLNAYYYFHDPKPYYSGGSDALIFKKEINGIVAYIKLDIEKIDSGKETVCLSFHPDGKR